MKSSIVHKNWREVTALVTSLRGTSRTPHQDLGRVRKVVEEGQALLQQTMKKFGGEQIDTLGTESTYLFGKTQIMDHASRALSSLLEIRRALEEVNRHWKSELVLTAGVCTGQLVLDQASEREYSVLGPALDRARRLCERAGEGCLMVSRRVVQLGRRSFLFELVESPREEREFILIGVSEHTTTGLAPNEILSHREIAEKWYQNFPDPEDAELTYHYLCGEPGVGKSYLLKGLAASLSTEKWSVFRIKVRSEPGPYQVVRRLWREVLDEAGESEDFLDRVGLDSSEYPGFSETLAPFVAEDEPFSPKFLDLVAQWAVVRPMAIFIDDFHLASPHDRLVIEQWRREYPDLPLQITLVVDALPDPRPARSWNYALETLDLGEMEAIFHPLLLDSGLGPMFLDRVHYLSQGNPTLAKAIIKSAKTDPERDPPPLPSIVRDALIQRIQSMSREANLVFSVAVCGGEGTTWTIVERLLKGFRCSRRQLEREMIDTRLIYPHPTEFIFATPYVVEARYDSLFQKKKKGLHEMICRLFDRRPDLIPSPTYRLRHYLLAGEEKNAVKYALDKATEMMARNGEQEVAASLLDLLEAHLTSVGDLKKVEDKRSEWGLKVTFDPPTDPGD